MRQVTLIPVAGLALALAGCGDPFPVDTLASSPFGNDLSGDGPPGWLHTGSGRVRR